MKVIDQFDAEKWAAAQQDSYQALAIIANQFIHSLIADELVSDSALFKSFDHNNDHDCNILRVAVNSPYYYMDSVFSFVKELIPRFEAIDWEARDWLMNMHCLAYLLNRYHKNHTDLSTLDIEHEFMSSGEWAVDALSAFGFLEKTAAGGNWTELGRKLLAGDFQ